MSRSVSEKVAEDIEVSHNTVKIYWHAGEPLSCEIKHFSSLLEPFNNLRQNNRVTHALQTNATLINKEWCDLFISNSIGVGVSIDGPRVTNINRVDWGGRETYDKIIRGIECLNSSGIRFSVICVVSKENLFMAKELYEFFCQLGCYSVGFNIEEQEGVHLTKIDDHQAVMNFWTELFQAWQKNPQIEVREIYWILSWMHSLCGRENLIETRYQEDIMCDIFPSIAYDGNVVLLSPGLVGTLSSKYQDFVVGNVLSESLSDLIKKGQKANYVREYIDGMHQCRKQCEYFDFCGGGQASNKFFELGSTSTL
jgi:uncharacterized protein